MVGREAAEQPEQLKIAPGLAFEPPARLHAVEVAVDVELQQHRRMEARPPRRGGRDTIEAETGEIERIDEGINDANRVFLVDPVIEALRKSVD